MNEGYMSFCPNNLTHSHHNNTYHMHNTQIKYKNSNYCVTWEQVKFVRCPLHKLVITVKKGE